MDLPRLRAYLPTVLADMDPAAGFAATLLAGGRSNLTCLLSQADRRWVLRRPPLGHVMPSAHDMSREYRTLSALARVDFPAPRPLALCEDESVLGVPFMVMEYVPGAVIASAEDAQAIGPEQSGRLCESLVHTLARLHAIAPPHAPAGRSSSSLHYLDRQLSRWAQQWHRTKTRDRAEFDRLAGRIAHSLAELRGDHPVTYVHGDYRIDNVIVDSESMTVRAVLDWEMSTLGDPLMDLALLAVYWEEPGDRLRREVAVARNITSNKGFWTRARILDEYCQLTGRTPDGIEVRLALACMKLAVIMESVHYRYLAGQAVDESSADLGDAAPALLALGECALAWRSIAGLGA